MRRKAAMKGACRHREEPRSGDAAIQGRWAPEGQSHLREGLAAGKLDEPNDSLGPKR